MQLRNKHIERLKAETFDVAIIGGGINGAVAAAALAGKGASVALIDRGDFAGETSSQSSNLAWGGIKYLESREFLLVNKLCKSRNLLMQSYPSTVKEIRFLTTIQKGFRFPPFFIYLGSLLYWVFGRFKTRAPAYLRPKNLKDRDAAIDISNAAGGLEYSDCFLSDNDSRFAFNFIRKAIDEGASVANYVESVNWNKQGDLWHHEALDHLNGSSFTIKARVTINACGPWVDKLNESANVATQHRHLFSKGVHLTVPKLSENKRVLAFFASDGRLFFVIPMGPATCIGTTDTQVESPEATVTDEDRRFIIDNVNRCLDLEKPLTVDDIIADRCGVRPLAVTNETNCEDWVQLSRKHEIDVNTKDNSLSIFGGKITDCINVGEEIAKLTRELGVELNSAEKKWYGEPSTEKHQEFLAAARQSRLDELTPLSSPEPLSERLWRRYGIDAFNMLKTISTDPSQAELLIENAEYLRCELEYAAEKEMISKLEDFMRRRSKIEMVVSKQAICQSPGLQEASKILFGEHWQAKLDEYIQSEPSSLSNIA